MESDLRLLDFLERTVIFSGHLCTSMSVLETSPCQEQAKNSVHFSVPFWGFEFISTDGF